MPVLISTGIIKDNEVLSMNEKEIGEIRRRTRRDRSNMTSIYGCYINAQKEIVSEFKKSVGMMAENEAEKFFALFKKTLSGSIGKNLIDIRFQTAQVANSPEHKFLMDLRASGLQNEELRLALYRKIIENVTFDESYLILLGIDSYDVPFKSKDGEEQADASTEIFTYVQCAVCPVKLSKSSLCYAADSKDFAESGTEQIACAPELGFLFPAFDNRATNIYNALFYTRSPKHIYENFVDSLFHVLPPKPAAEQKTSFEALLTRTVGDDCSLQVVQAVHEQLCQCIEIHKESKVADPLLVGKDQVKFALEASGVSEKNVSKFSVEFDEVFGADSMLHPKNIINNKRFEVKTPDVSITVSPECSDLIETRIIDGIKYIMICADENIEVNGVNIHIKDGNT